MALQLKIVSEHRDLVGDDYLREFHEQGGTIGRALENDWILPDPDRYISSRHAAIDYKAGNIGQALDAIGGIDVYFDNVGGAMLDDVLTRMNHYGRIAVCGLLADYGGSRTAPQEFDQVLMRRLRIEGFFSPDFMQHGPELTARLKQWHEAGELIMPYDSTRGLENVLSAYAKLFTGGNIGKVIVELGQ